METIKSKINERSCAMELRLEHLVKDFSGTKAVNDVSITIQDGKLTGLLGPSGCGKSTTLYLISGLESPTSGRIFFGDRDVTALPPEKRGIGLVFQNYALYPHLTVEQNIAFPLVNHKEGKEEIRRRTLEMARLVQIEDLLKRKPGQLSGGQQQRVAIARALVKRPDILLLDEPLSCDWRCGKRFAASRLRRASPPCSSPMIKRRP